MATKTGAIMICYRVNAYRASCTFSYDGRIMYPSVALHQRHIGKTRHVYIQLHVLDKETVTTYVKCLRLEEVP